MLKRFSKYVLQSILATVGISVYILADTFYIAKCAGADGLAVLNLVLPMYGLTFAVGALIGIGAATWFSIRLARGQDTDKYFLQSILWSVIFSIPFVILGAVAPEATIRMLGADDHLAAIGVDYMRIMLLFTPLFMCNYTFTGFVRNDKAPTIAMVAAIMGSLFNIVFDYILMFPLGLGLTGAALATAFSPLVTMLVCSIRFFSKKSRIRFRWSVPSVSKMISFCKLGVPAFVGEIAGGVTTITFNFLILKIAGNIGVAAYGVITNIALVVAAIYGGIGQGIQPLISESYGKKEYKHAKQYLRYGVILALAFTGLLLLTTFGATDTLIGLFNSEQNQQLRDLAYTGLRLYFFCFVFGSVNIMYVTYFAATNRVAPAFIGSICRGVVVIVLCAVVMALCFGMNGIWLSQLVSEMITFGIIMIMNRHVNKKTEDPIKHESKITIRE